MFKIGQDTVARIDSSFTKDRVWLTIEHHQMTFQPDVTRESPAELRKMADEIEKAYGYIDRTANRSFGDGPFVFRSEPSGELRGEF